MEDLKKDYHAAAAELVAVCEVFAAVVQHCWVWSVLHCRS